jgi:hypothetical protein
MIGEVTVLPGFTNASTDLDQVIEDFIHDEGRVLFRIPLYLGDVAVYVENLAESP